MNIEKGILICSIIFFLAVVGFFMMQTALESHSYNINNVFVNRSLLVSGERGVEEYRFTSDQDPFKERMPSDKIEVKMDLPEMQGLKMEKPPVIWRKEK